MSQIRFNHVFLALLALSVLSAFFIPEKTSQYRAHAQGLFAPVARPVHLLAGWVHDRVAPPERDPGVPPGSPSRPLAEIQSENLELRNLVTNLQAQIEDLAERARAREMIGRAKDYCEPFRVMGADSGHREALALVGAPPEGLREGMKAVYPFGVVGQVERVSSGALHVQLITDRNFRAIGRFVRDGVPIETPEPLVEGQGDGVMKVLLPHEKGGEQIKAGDRIVLDDRDWPQFLQGFGLGQVVEVRKSNKALFDDIYIRPDRNLLQLREVQVQVKEE